MHFSHCLRPHQTAPAHSHSTAAHGGRMGAAQEPRSVGSVQKSPNRSSRFTASRVKLKKTALVSLSGPAVIASWQIEVCGLYVVKTNYGLAAKRNDSQKCYAKTSTWMCLVHTSTQLFQTACINMAVSTYTSLPLGRSRQAKSASRATYLSMGTMSMCGAQEPLGTHTHTIATNKNTWY